MDCHSSIHQKFLNWDTHLLSKCEFHWLNISKRKQQCFMAFFLCKIFLEYPFSSLKKWEKYCIINWNWTPPKNYRHPNVSADERGKIDYLTSKLSGGLMHMFNFGKINMYKNCWSVLWILGNKGHSELKR